jgi:translocation and assembly module TamB
VIRGPEGEAEPPDDALGMLLAGQPAEEEPAAPAPREDSLEDRLAMRVAVRIGDRVIIRRTDAHLRLTGELTVTKDPGGEVRVVGAIESTNGWYLFQGRRLEIERAAVRFSGEWPIDPDVDVRATARSGGYDVTVQVLGTISEPSLELSSSPPLDQGDILAVLLFGKPTSELSGGQGAMLQQQALGLATSYVAPQLQRSLMDTFGLAAVTVSMPSDERAGTVGIGRYFGEDLFVSLAQDFGGPKGGTQRQLQGLIGTSVTIQYSLTPSLTLQTASSTEGESSVDVIWRRRY